MLADFFQELMLLPGIKLLLGVQLIVVSVLLFSYRRKISDIPLAALCLIYGLWFFKAMSTPLWADSIFLFVVLGPGKPIFAGAILLFFYRSLSAPLKTNYVVRHLTIPAAYYILLLCFRVIWIESFSEPMNVALSFSFTVAVFAIFWYYFFLTRRELTEHLQERLIPKAYQKVLWLFYSLYFFLLQVPIWDLMGLLIAHPILPEPYQSYLGIAYGSFFKYVGEYLSYTYLHVLGYFVFLYALSEIHWIRRLILPKDTIISEKALQNRQAIDQLLHQHFILGRLYAEPDLSLERCATVFGLTKKELIDYFVVTQKGPFKDFVNQHRVEAFKSLLLSGEADRYDLVSLAKRCGFRSKSTFFRVFKEREGVSPSAYKQLHDKGESQPGPKSF